MTPKFDIVAGSRTKVSDLESGYHNVLAMKIINIYLCKSYTNSNLNGGKCMKIGLCLSGGGVKGAAHIGALKALEEENKK